MVDGYAHNGSQKHYCCGSWVPGEQVDRTRECYEAQIAALEALVREMKEKIKYLPCLCQFRPLSSLHILEGGADGWPHFIDCKKHLLMKIMEAPE
jgi:hypothetical protein